MYSFMFKSSVQARSRVGIIIIINIIYRADNELSIVKILILISFTCLFR